MRREHHAHGLAASPPRSELLLQIAAKHASSTNPATRHSSAQAAISSPFDGASCFRVCSVRCCDASGLSVCGESVADAWPRPQFSTHAIASVPSTIIDPIQNTMAMPKSSAMDPKIERVRAEQRTQGSLLQPQTDQHPREHRQFHRHREAVSGEPVNRSVRTGHTRCAGGRDGKNARDEHHGVPRGRDDGQRGRRWRMLTGRRCFHWNVFRILQSAVPLQLWLYFDRRR